MRASLVALMLALLPCGALAQSVQEWRLCRAEDTDHLVIPACTRLIESNTLSQRDLAFAYVMRGKAHWRQRDYDDAIADENEALKIDPNLVAAYVARSAA
jgi:tetratricopeptide (TPR) repeat protein